MAGATVEAASGVQDALWRLVMAWVTVEAGHGRGHCGGWHGPGGNKRTEGRSVASGHAMVDCAGLQGPGGCKPGDRRTVDSGQGRGYYGGWHVYGSGCREGHGGGGRASTCAEVAAGSDVWGGRGFRNRHTPNTKAGLFP
ncbi:hypothetical protein NDU88_011356 [Pleurodeles waltl]|uniref:Uncharacterized protein n=1 Tax=Pleurodeles waltl TaxID=8319 RepID=A0AAV7PXI8_PLEWA|nr:hypothetical protein NDU88_011356 [Pleurodeles waltl]